MGKIITIHSFRGGTGKSNLSANLAVWTAQQGNRVAVIDTDVQSPGIHVIFGLGREKISHTLNDFLRGNCTISDTSVDLTKKLGLRRGSLYVIPASLNAKEITRILREGYEVADLRKGFIDIVREKKLDYLFIDTHPGVDRETLLSMATTDYLFIVMRVDEQDFLGTAITIEISKKLSVPHVSLIVNMVPGIYDFENVRYEIERQFGIKVATIIPLYKQMFELGSRHLMTLKYPNHEFTKRINEIYKYIAR